MDAILLDKNFTMIRIIDQYESFIWTERYQEYGDFELYMPARQDVIDAIEPDYYIRIKNSDRMMIIEGVNIESNKEDGAKLKITGRSLESILLRRIVWKNTIISGKVEEAIEKLFKENIIEPKDNKRKIANFIYQKSDDNLSQYVFSKESQYLGDSLYDIVYYTCIEFDLGFKIILDDDYNFVFQFYSGKNRTDGNNEGYPPVMFSPSFDNLISSNYAFSNYNLKNATLIGGEQDNDTGIRKFAEYGKISGLERREIFTDSSGLNKSFTNSEGKEIILSDSEYELQLIASGEDTLTENAITQTFEGEMDTVITFRYGRDFSLGDILHVKNEYGIEAVAKVTEFVMSYDSDGYKTYPNFTVMYDRGKVYLNDVGDVTITDPKQTNILRRASDGLWRNYSS